HADEPGPADDRHGNRGGGESGTSVWGAWRRRGADRAPARGPGERDLPGGRGAHARAADVPGAGGGGPRLPGEWGPLSEAQTDREERAMTLTELEQRLMALE